MIEEEEWKDQAACKGKPVELFYLQEKDKLITTGAGGHPMRKVCYSCPVLKECRRYAISNELHGYWGGMTARARQNERSRLGITLPFRRSK